MVVAAGNAGYNKGNRPDSDGIGYEKNTGRKGL